MPGPRRTRWTDAYGSTNDVPRRGPHMTRVPRRTTLTSTRGRPTRGSSRASSRPARPTVWSSTPRVAPAATSPVVRKADVLAPGHSWPAPRPKTNGRRDLVGVSAVCVIPGLLAEAGQHPRADLARDVVAATAPAMDTPSQTPCGAASFTRHRMLIGRPQRVEADPRPRGHPAQVVPSRRGPLGTELHSGSTHVRTPCRSWPSTGPSTP